MGGVVGGGVEVAVLSKAPPRDKRLAGVSIRFLSSVGAKTKKPAKTNTAEISATHGQLNMASRLYAKLVSLLIRARCRFATEALSRYDVESMARWQGGTVFWLRTTSSSK